MRGLILLSLILIAGVALWFGRDFVPEPVGGWLAGTEAAIEGAFAPPLPAPGEPIWPDAIEKAPGLPLSWLLLAVGLVAAAGGLGLFWRLRQAGSASAPPAWLAAARSLAAASGNARERNSHCDFIERKLVPDMRQRGETALARAHQLDLYWRYVSRASLADRAPLRSAERERLREITRKTLDSVALPAGGRIATAFQQSKPSLWALEAGDAREVRRYYDGLGALLNEHRAAWEKAQAAVGQPSLDHTALFDSMEELRQINRSIAKQSAALIGDIEISVRALS